MSNEDFGKEYSIESSSEEFSQIISEFLEDLSQFMKNSVISGSLDSSVAIAKLILAACETRRSVIMGLTYRTHQ